MRDDNSNKNILYTWYTSAVRQSAMEERLAGVRDWKMAMLASTSS